MVRQDQNATPKPGETLVDSVKILHSIGVPAAEIARRLHIDQASVLHVIEHGTLPARQLPLLWRDAGATNHPLRIQRRRTKGFRHPIGTQHITRPGRFGNPFISAESFAAWLESGDVADDLRDPLTAEALEERRQWILTNVHTLRGKILACFCGLGKPCHGDELARLANGTGVAL